MGFEPTNTTLGRWCLTTWRHPLTPCIIAISKKAVKKKIQKNSENLFRKTILKNDLVKSSYKNSEKLRVGISIAEYLIWISNTEKS